MTVGYQLEPAVLLTLTTLRPDRVRHGLPPHPSPLNDTPGAE